MGEPRRCLLPSSCRPGEICSSAEFAKRYDKASALVVYTRGLCVAPIPGDELWIQYLSYETEQGNIQQRYESNKLSGTCASRAGDTCDPSVEQYRIRGFPDRLAKADPVLCCPDQELECQLSFDGTAACTPTMMGLYKLRRTGPDYCGVRGDFCTVTAATFPQGDCCADFTCDAVNKAATDIEGTLLKCVSRGAP